ncbi:MAG: CinA family protein [Bacteroidaceae bacterium]|nr:CinA family protein [Bacteroidaceae bacterium]
MTGKLNQICEEIQRILISRRETLSTAESCTGGRIASAITAISGSSAYFQGALVAYQNEVKVKMLHVSPETIEQCDVVSREVVNEMLRGACEMFGTTYAITTSGYAGPGGGSDKVPQGTIWMAYGSPDHIHTYCITEDKGRILNVEYATLTALSAFLTYLNNI